MIHDDPRAELAVISSKHRDSARALASRFGCEAAEGWEPVVERSDLDIIPGLYAARPLREDHLGCARPRHARAMRETPRAYDCGGGAHGGGGPAIPATRLVLSAYEASQSGHSRELV